MSGKTVILFGGNGFVGTAIAKILVEHGHEVRCISRSEIQPVHLETVSWAQEVKWLKGDATEPDLELLKGVDVSIALVGTPPVPTFSKEDWKRQRDNNSLPNIGVINASQNAGIERIVILGAHLPKLIDRDSFGYAKGKRLVMEAAQQYCNSSSKYSAIILKPTAIYGLRHSKEGKLINVEGLLKPVAGFHGMLPGPLKKVLPEQFVSVKAVARAAVDACFNEKYAGHLYVMPNQEILTFPKD